VHSFHLTYLLETIASLQAFRKRHSEAQRLAAQYDSQPTTVDFAHYRSVLKNKAVVDDAEKLLKDFKPVTYDVNAHVNAIETFEVKAVCVIFWGVANTSFLISWFLLD
jgi:F-type H+-transporting ATPase subunit d